MKQSKIIEVCKILKQLENVYMPLSMSYKFYKLSKALAPNYEFQEQQELKLFDEYEAKYDNGVITFANKDDAPMFYQKFNELINMDVELDESVAKMLPVRIAVSDGFSIAAKDIRALEGFVEFEEA